MNYQVEKFVQNVVPPAAIVNNASVTANVIDTQGFRFLEVYVILGATDIALTALKLTESDVKSSGTALTSPADISAANASSYSGGTVMGTDKNDTGVTSTLPSATDDNHVFKFEIDLRGRKRYILPVITVGNGSTGAYVCVLAELSRGENMPGTAAGKNVTQLMRAN